MADTVTETSTLKAEMPSPGSKRKRGGGDLSPESRRVKRAAPPANMVPSTDASSLHFLESAGESSGVDLSALQQANEAANHPDQSHQHQPVVTDVSNASTTAAAALSMYPTMHVPPTTEQQFVQAAAEATNTQDGGFADTSHVTQNEAVGSPGVSLPPNQGPIVAPPNGTQTPQPQLQPSPQPQQIQHPPPPPGQQPPQRTEYQFRKPPVGSEEWHKLRKDNHKEVERRRRETINEGINELAKIVPGCEKNKGSILQKAVQFIQTLKQNETSNIEKWTLEKLLTEQAIGELSVSNEKLKSECARLYEQIDMYKRALQEHGIEDPIAKADVVEETSPTG